MRMASQRVLVIFLTVGPVFDVRVELAVQRRKRSGQGFKHEPVPAGETAGSSCGHLGGSLV